MASSAGALLAVDNCAGGGLAFDTFAGLTGNAVGAGVGVVDLLAVRTSFLRETNAAAIFAGVVSFAISRAA